LAFMDMFPEYNWLDRKKKGVKNPLGEIQKKKKARRHRSLLKSEYPVPIQHSMTRDMIEPIPGAPPVSPSGNHWEINLGVALAHVWSDSVNPTGYWISEKFDGWRALWNGTTLVSRHGKKLRVPDYWIAELPKGDCILDGELFVGYNQYHVVSRIVQTGQEVDGQRHTWRDMKFMVFDYLPSKNDAHLHFEERYELLKQNIKENSVIKIVPHYLCLGSKHLLEERDRVYERGGEGLIIRKPNTCYTAGRSDAVLKVRKQLDCEVKFLDKSATGVSYDCMLPNGILRKVKCGMSDYNHPPEHGSVITVNHFGFLPNGTLKFPDFRRVRFDMTWEEVQERYKDSLVIVEE